MTAEARTDWGAIHGQWVALGGDPARFWTLTPSVAMREIKALSDHRRESYRLAAWQAWHTALWQRVAAKKFPKLSDVTDFRDRKPSHEKQSPEIMFANMKAVYLAFGGDPSVLKTLQ